MSQDAGPPSSVEASLDLFLDGAIMGWARDVERPHEAITVQLYLGARRISLHRADRFRPDLAEAGLGTGRYGFEIAVPPALVEQARLSGERLAIRTAHRPDLDLVWIDFDEALDVPPQQREILAYRLDGAKLPPAGPLPAPLPATPAYRVLLAPVEPHPASRPPLFAYAEHVRRVRQMEDRFDPARIASDLDHFIRHYIDVYNAPRAPRRAPLSREVIAWLNELVVLGGSPFSITRVMMWYLAESPQGLGALGDPELYRKFLLWWACEQAPTLNVEDCLVSRFHVDDLRQTPEHWIGRPFPLSRFMEEALLTRQSLAGFGAVQSLSSRVTAYLALAAEALEVPGLLRFVPKAVLDRLFGGTSPLFDTLAAAACAGDPVARPLDAQRYRERLLARGFDLDTLQFLSVDAVGHRSEAIRLGGVPAAAPVDVQLIGPLNKVSGIAHAARQSRAILQATGLGLAVTDYGLDNPQPEQEKDGAAFGCVATRVNLIHLNADMLPLAFAYLPDLHAGAYTIGFFFWELDRPADCHRLALDLVDEVWVASEYNRRCFAAWTEKPVINIGMALDVGAMPERCAARAGLERTGRVSQGDFVFLTTYDSLSYVSRKNPLGVLNAFRAAFPTEPNVRLIIKTHNAAFITDGLARRVWDEVLRAAAEDSRIVVVNETLPYRDVMELKAASDCYVSLHRSEGFGFGMLEAMRLGIPVVCTAASGNLDFCDATTAWLVEADEIGVRPGDYAHVSPGHRWAEPRHDSAVAALRGVRNEGALRSARVSAATAMATDRYGIPAAAARYRERLDAILADRPADAVSTPAEPSRPGERRRRLFGRSRAPS